MPEEELDRACPMTKSCREGIMELLVSTRGLILGLTGGIATGKSTVGSMLAEQGAWLIDFDVLAREVVEPGTPALKEIVKIFGNNVLNRYGGLDRKALGRIVFSEPHQRKRLEAVTHPRIFDLYLRKVGTILKERECAIIIADIPLLFEMNLEDLFHAVVLVYAPEPLQKRRLMERDGISTRRAEQILKSQMPIDEKVSRARFVLYNDGGLDQTRGRVDALWRRLQQMRRAVR
jgi:dephospho-CoA kinase